MFWLISHSNLHTKLSNYFWLIQIPPWHFPNPHIYPFSLLFKISMPKTVYLHFFKFESKTVPFFATTLPFFNLSTPIIAQFKALNLLFHCIPIFATHIFFHPSGHQFDFFSTTPLLVPPSKSQFFYSYLTQFVTLNSQIIFYLIPNSPLPFSKSSNLPHFTPF